MDLTDYSYILPVELIACEPIIPQDRCKLMVLDKKNQTIDHSIFFNLPNILQNTDVLVVNNTKVLPVRLLTKRESGGLVELLLIKPVADNVSNWIALAKPVRRLKVGEDLLLTNEIENGQMWKLKVMEVFTSAEGYRRIILNLGPVDKLYINLQKYGFAPLPPYINQDVDRSRIKDLHDYQTIFAKADGAIAAPTAGLHFTHELMLALRNKGIKILEVTLHVGPGTFKPITSDVNSHVVESEEFSIDEATAQELNTAKQMGKRIIAVGTTTVRALESAYENGKVQAVSQAQTSLYIKPGYRFKVTNGLITNFHLSQSSLLLLVAAMAGPLFIKKAYGLAVENKYRFYSYGDSMLIL